MPPDNLMSPHEDVWCIRRRLGRLACSEQGICFEQGTQHAGHMLRARDAPRCPECRTCPGLLLLSPPGLSLAPWPYLSPLTEVPGVQDMSRIAAAFSEASTSTDGNSRK